MKITLPILLLVMAAPAPALAARPASCAVGLGQSGYNAGYEAQSKVLEKLWRDHQQACDQFDLFKNKVEIALTRDPPANVFLRCRRAGMLEAFNDAVSRIASACTSSCTLDLEPYTKLSARIFCSGTAAGAFAEALSKEDVARPNCAGDDWTTCKEKVKSEAQAACPRTVMDQPRAIEQLAAAACLSAE